MRHDVDARLAAIAAELERRRLIQEEPVDDLSKSLYGMGQELAVLDEQGKAALLEALNISDDEETGSLDLTLEDINRMIADWRG